MTDQQIINGQRDHIRRLEKSVRGLALRKEELLREIQRTKRELKAARKELE